MLVGGGGGGGWLCEGSRDILKIQLLYLGFFVMCFVVMCFSDHRYLKFFKV